MKLQKLRRLGFCCIGATTLFAGMLFAGESAASRLEESANVMQEIMETPDNAIPQELLQSCQCIVIVPGMKKGDAAHRNFVLYRHHRVPQFMQQHARKEHDGRHCAHKPIQQRRSVIELCGIVTAAQHPGEQHED